MMWGFQLELKKGLRTKKIWAVIVILSLIYVPFFYLLKRSSEELTATSVMGLTISFVSGMAMFFLGIVAIVVGATAINGEIEKGTLRVALSKKITRSGYILGKFLAQITVFGIAILLATLVEFAGMLYIGVNLTGGLVRDLLLINLLLLVVMVEFVAMGYLLSTFLKSSGTALGTGIAVFFILLIFVPLVISYQAYTHSGNMSINGVQNLSDEYNTKYAFYSPMAQFNVITGHLSKMNPVNRTITDSMGNTRTYTTYNETYQGVAYAIRKRWVNTVLLFLMTAVYFGVAMVRFLRMDLR
ncbi:ABC transporter permease subunit [Thermococcus sp.]|uniref:ABC transporter permease subunit n=1 Tax=Thermococcus sp. TaxID=35749 RepID=UPI0025DDF61C|nr:ABC transporter permease subunit [Thermococcus sp.]